MLLTNNTKTFSTDACDKPYKTFSTHAGDKKLQLKNNLKLRFNEQIFRNLLRNNAYRRLRRPGVTCIHNVNFAI